MIPSFLGIYYFESDSSKEFKKFCVFLRLCKRLVRSQDLSWKIPRDDSMKCIGLQSDLLSSKPVLTRGMNSQNGVKNEISEKPKLNSSLDKNRQHLKNLRE